MYLDPSEKVTSWTMVAWYLPFDLGRFIDPILCRISNVKMCNAFVRATAADESGSGNEKGLAGDPK